jgi:hypothetical protein
MAVNSLGFWPEPVARLRQLHALLRPGGLIAIATQPRCPGATTATSEAAGTELLVRLKTASFHNSASPNTLDARRGNAQKASLWRAR